MSEKSVWKLREEKSHLLRKANEGECTSTVEVSELRRRVEEINAELKERENL